MRKASRIASKLTNVKSWRDEESLVEMQGNSSEHSEDRGISFSVCNADRGSGRYRKPEVRSIAEPIEWVMIVKLTNESRCYTRHSSHLQNICRGGRSRIRYTRI